MEEYHGVADKDAGINSVCHQIKSEIARFETVRPEVHRTIASKTHKNSATWTFKSWKEIVTAGYPGCSRNAATTLA